MSVELSMRGQVALVTGGGGGIGSAICQKLAQAGGRVIIIGVHLDVAQTAVAVLPGEGHLARSVLVDDSAALKKFAVQIADQYGKLDLLVNCAGVTRQVAHDDLDGLDDELIDRIFRVNWRGAFATIRAFKELLAKDAGGTIVNISSIAGTTGVGSNVAYCASKAAMDSMTRSLARALAPKIRVLSVAPGWVEGEYAKKMNPEMLTLQRKLTPLNRIAHSEDVANAVLAAATLLSFSTGDIIHVDGGRRLS